MTPELAAKLLTLLTLAEVWRKMRAYDDLALAHSGMKDLLDFPPDGVELEISRLLNQAKIRLQKNDVAEVARCHAEMRALLEGVAG
jgi:hypothetical protein